MADDDLPLLTAVLASDISDFTAGIDEAKEQIASLAETVDEATGDIDATLDDAGEGFDRIGESADEAADSTETSAGRMSEAFTGVRDDIAAAGDEIDTTLNSTTDSLARVGDAADEAASVSEDSASRISEAFAGVRDDMATVGAGIDESFDTSFDALQASATDSASRISEAFAGVRDDMATVGGEIDETMGTSFDAVGTEAEEAAARAKVAMDSLRDTTVASSTEMDTSLAAGMAGGAEVGARGLRDAEEDAEDDAEGFSGRVSSMFKSIGSSLGGLGIPFAETFNGMGEKIEDAESSGNGLKTSLLSLAHVATAVTGVAIAGVAAESIHLAVDQQSAATSLASSAGISVKAAQSIGNAFEGTAFKTIYSGTDMTKAYAQVAAQLATVQGHALDNAQALKVMTAAGDLAEGSGTDLNTSTQALAATMQAYGINAAGASGASDVLFNAAEQTGQGVSQVGGALDKVKTKLGDLAPPLAQTSGLLVDMTEHGETGRAAMSTLSTAFTALIGPTNDTVKAQENLKVATDDLPPSLQKLARQYQDGKVNATQLEDATNNMTGAQSAAWTSFQSAATAADTASQAQQKLGISVTTASGKIRPLSQIIGELHNQVKGMSTSEAVAKLSADGLGSSSAKLLSVIQAGPAAYNAATAAVDKEKSAHEAAEKQAQTFDHQLELLKAGLEDEGVKIGEFLIPKLEDLVHWTTDVVEWFTRHKTTAEALAGVIGGVLAIAVGVTAVQAFAAMVTKLYEAGAATVEFITEDLPLWVMYAAEWVSTTAGAAAEFVTTQAAALGTWVTETAVSVVETGGLWAMYAAEWIGEQVGAMTTFMVEHAVMAASFVAENAVMIASAVAAFIAENAATLGIVAGLALLVAGIVYVATHWKEVWETIKNVATDVWHYLDGIWDDIKNDATKTWDDIKDVLTAAWRAIDDAVTDYINTVKKVISDGWNDVKDITSEVWDFIKDHLSAILPTIATIITDPIGALVTYITAHWTQVKNITTEIWDDIRQFFVTLWNDVSGDVRAGIDEVVTWFEGLPGKAYSAVLSLVGDMRNIASSAMSGLYDGMIDGFWDVLDWCYGLPNQLYNALSGAFGAMEDVGIDIVNGLIAGIEGGAGAIWNALKSILPSGGAVGKALNAIGLAEGGIVTKPTLAIVGEAGYPEAVIPLKNGVSAKGFNATVEDLNGIAGGHPGNLAVTFTGSGSGSPAATQGSTTLEIHLELNGREIAQGMWPDLRGVMLENKRQLVQLGIS